jgi:hypothetical protein
MEILADVLFVTRDSFCLSVFDDVGFRISESCSVNAKNVYSSGGV